jgi:hypothetical protein
MKLVDTDGNGVIDFDELCAFVALGKKGGAPVKFEALITAMGDSVFSTVGF